MSVNDILDTLRRFDAYPKTQEDIRIKTFGGATVTVLSCIIMVTLFVSELRDYLSPNVSEELFVDISRGPNLRINIDFVVPRISCEFLVLDAMDSSGEQHLQIEHNIYKRRLDLLGNPIEEPQKEDLGTVSEIVQKDVNKTQECGSCYGAETEDLPYVTICGNHLVNNLRELKSYLSCKCTNLYKFILSNGVSSAFILLYFLMTYLRK